MGNNAADEAADFGRRRVGNAVIDARRNLSGVCGRWYPVILDLHRFFISRAVVNHDGIDGIAPDPLVWPAGALPKRRRLVHATRDRAMLPGPPFVWDSEWVNVPASSVTADDTASWRYTTGLLDKWVAFLGSLYWPADGLDLGVLVVFLVLNCLLFMSFGLVRGCLWRRLILAIFDRGVQFQCRLFLLVHSLIFSVLVVYLVL